MQRHTYSSTAKFFHKYLWACAHSEGVKELKASVRSSGPCPKHQVTAFKSKVSASKGESLSQTNVYFKSIICLSLDEEELGLVCLFSFQPLGSKPRFFKHGTSNGSSSALVRASVCL